MIQPHETLEFNKPARAACSTRPEWWAFARKAMRRLQQSAGDASPEVFTLDDCDDDTAPMAEHHAERATASAASTPSLLDLLNEHPQIYGLPPEEWDAILDAGGDPAATQEAGHNHHPLHVAPRKLLLLARMAASFGSGGAFAEVLRPGAITLLEEVPEEDLGLLESLMTCLLPEGWDLFHPKDSSNTPGCLTIVKPKPSDGRASAPSTTAFSNDLLAAIESAAPVLIILPAGGSLPPDLPTDHLNRISLAPLCLETLIAALCTSHSSTGRIDEAATRRALPPDRSLAHLSPLAITLAMRADTARAVAARLATLATAADRAPRNDGPRLEEFSGSSPALSAARQMVRDLQAWQRGEVAWKDLNRSMLLYGPPGTGKTWLACAMGNSAGLSTVRGTFGEWQSSGHLGDMLKAIRATFAQARASAPAVLIIDELDAVGSREDREPRNFSYKVQVINAFLAEMDGIASQEGVMVIGSCNHIDLIDPAVIRAGRFDLKLEVPLPDAGTLSGVFRGHFPEWSEPDLRKLGEDALGQSMAEVDALIRQALVSARGQARSVTPADLRAMFSRDRDPDHDWRVAIHECGHAIVCAALGLGRVTRVMLGLHGGGEVVWTPTVRHGVARNTEDLLAHFMAGRAAERLVFGEVSDGAGGDRESDIAKATVLALRHHSRHGHGLFGPVWMGMSEDRLLHDPAIRNRIRAQIDAGEERALEVLVANHDLLEPMARALVERRAFDEHQITMWLGRLGKSAGPPD